MTAAPQAIILSDVNVSGATRRKIIRAKDATIRTLKSGYIYVDPDDPTYDAATQTGHSLIGGWRWFFNDAANLAVADSGAFNNQPVFVLTGSQHHLRVVDPPNLASYTIIACLSMPASVLSAADAFTLGNRYVVSVYDEVANGFIVLFQFTASGSFKGWAVSPKSLSGNALNISVATFPAARPVADVPFIVAWHFDLPTLTSEFYFADAATPITSRNDHAEGDAGGANGRYWPLSFGPGTNTAGWEGKSGPLLISDDSDPSTAMTAEQRIGIFEDWSAAYGIT